MSFAWAASQKAIQDWVVSGSGLADANVIWANAEGTRPAGKFIMLEITGWQQKGLDWVDELKVYGVRVGELTLQCFAASVAGTGSAAATLENVITSSFDPLNVLALNNAGVGLGKWGNVQPISGLINTTTFEPRAIVRVSFHVSLETTLGTAPGWIGTAELEGQ